MNCQAVCERMSAYHDGELDDSLAAEVRSHLAACGSCRAKCRCFEEISALASAAGHGGGGPPAWSSVLERLEGRTSIFAADAKSSSWRTAAMAVFAIAAALIVVAGLWRAAPPAEHHGAHRLAASIAPIDLGAVIERFGSGPDAAVELLTRQSGAREVTPVAAGDGRSPHAIASVAGARPVSTRMFQFPHCTCAPGECVCKEGGCGCVASIYQRDDRSTFLVVEQCKSHPVSFGLLPRQRVEKGGRAVERLRADDLLAISWESDRRRYTAIGLKGDREADQVFEAAAGNL